MAKILIGITDDNKSEELNLAMANRHGLIAGATGTGKTVTLQRIAEQFSKAGVPVFAADIKGDLAGIAEPSQNDTKIKNRLATLKITNFTPQGCPVILWDLYGKNGLQLRTTISEVGPLLLGRILNANDVQQGIITAAFSFADDSGLLLLDLKDFSALLDWVSENASSLKSKYGNISSASIGALKRSLLTLTQQGGNQFFGEPAIKLEHLTQTDFSGKGVISILDATTLINDAGLYSTFLLWLLSELFEKLPEVGDLEKPKLVFIFDEAHLLFNSAPKILLEKIEQMVRLIRSKGVGIYFITQSPLDIPENVLGQLGNRLQHALRAFTPKDQKAVKTAARTFRQNPSLNTEEIISELSVGEALVSFLDDEGTPNIVEKIKVVPPESRIGAISNTEREELINRSPLRSIYETTLDRESAYEIIQKKFQMQQPNEQQTKSDKPSSQYKSVESVAEVLMKSTARTVGNQIGRQIIRGILGSLFGGKK